MVGVHAVTTAALREVLDVAESKLAATVLVSLELRDGSIGGLGSIKANHAGAPGASAWLVLDLRLLDLSDGSEELNQILVAGRPWKLRGLSAIRTGQELAARQGNKLTFRT